MKFPDLQRGLIFANLNSHTGGSRGLFTKKNLLAIAWNDHIYTGNSCLRSPNPHISGNGVQCTIFFSELNEMSFL